MTHWKRVHYLEAFGVPEFLYSERIDAVEVSMQKMHVQCLVIETSNTHSFCQTGKTQDFLLKMLSAIGLKKSDIKCLNIEINNLPHVLNQYEAKTVLLMSKGLASSVSNHFSIHHPSDILGNNVLKREAWEALKKVQICLK
jgi:hypothetical protein